MQSAYLHFKHPNISRISDELSGVYHLQDILHIWPITSFQEKIDIEHPKCVNKDQTELQECRSAYLIAYAC